LSDLGWTWGYESIRTWRCQKYPLQFKIAWKVFHHPEHYRTPWLWNTDIIKIVLSFWAFVQVLGKEGRQERQNRPKWQFPWYRATGECSGRDWPAPDPLSNFVYSNQYIDGRRKRRRLTANTSHSPSKLRRWRRQAIILNQSPHPSVQPIYHQDALFLATSKVIQQYCGGHSTNG